MINKESRKAQRFIDECAAFCKKAEMKNKQQVYDWLLADLIDSYKNVAKWRLESIADEFIGDICSRMGIRK